MAQQTATKSRDRIIETLEHQTRPLALEEIASSTGMSVDQLRGEMGVLAKDGVVQRLFNDHYRYSPIPLPQKGQTFSGEVTGTSYKGGTIVRDAAGSSWRVEPV